MDLSEESSDKEDLASALVCGDYDSGNDDPVGAYHEDTGIEGAADERICQGAYPEGTGSEGVAVEKIGEGANPENTGSELAAGERKTEVEVQPVVENPTVALDGPEFGPHRKLSRGDEQYSLQTEIKYAKEKKFICSLDLFLELFVGCCRSPGCREVPKVKHHFVGATLVVNTLCPVGHKFRFCSSHEVNGIYANNLQSAAAVVLSGNNFGKISRMAQFLGLAFPSKAAFFRIQSLYIFPAVEEWWSWMRGELIREFVGMDVVVGGDGQCDSPGFSAKNLCYFLMEVTTSYILEIEVRDKRHVGLSSANMEKEALRNALNRLSAVLKVVEVATDASASIKKMICKYAL